eukprot:211472_1
MRVNIAPIQLIPRLLIRSSHIIVSKTLFHTIPVYRFKQVRVPNQKYGDTDIFSEINNHNYDEILNDLNNNIVAVEDYIKEISGKTKYQDLIIFDKKYYWIHIAYITLGIGGLSLWMHQKYKIANIYHV